MCIRDRGGVGAPDPPGLQEIDHGEGGRDGERPDGEDRDADVEYQPYTVEERHELGGFDIQGSDRQPQGEQLSLIHIYMCIRDRFYTGGSNPYGYRGLGELFVFVFFGLVATLGTEYLLTLAVTWVGLAGAVGVGLLASAILVANNLRYIPTD